MSDPADLLPLLAVRLLGGKAVPADSTSLKAIKALVKDAVQRGWLRQDKTKVPDPSKPPNKKGQPATKNQAVVHLTEAGERVLAEAGRPELLAATASGTMESLRHSLEQDRQQLRSEVLAALSGPKDTKLKDADKLAKAVQELNRKVDTLLATLQGPDQGPLLSRIDGKFAELSAKVGEALRGLGTATGTAKPKVTEPPPTAERARSAAETAGTNIASRPPLRV